MPELRDLYQQVIVDHNKHPRHRGKPPRFTHEAAGNNPLCGDRIAIFVEVEDGVIRDIGFEGAGCAISTASASLMTSAVIGKSVEEAERLFAAFHEMVVAPEVPADPKALGKLAACAGVRGFPARVKCANLAWHTLHAALTTRPETVSTE
jgi:nitrogen fixation NifU-like protein